MIVELLPLVLFSQIFFFAYYIKKRRSKLLHFIEKSYHDGLISAKERDHYAEMYSFGIFSFINVARIPEPGQLTKGSHNSKYAAFYGRSNKLGKVYIAVLAVSVVVLFVLAAIQK